VCNILAKDDVSHKNARKIKVNGVGRAPLHHFGPSEYSATTKAET
jgi:hypothetical protein